MSDPSKDWLAEPLPAPLKAVSGHPGIHPGAAKPRLGFSIFPALLAVRFSFGEDARRKQADLMNIRELAQQLGLGKSTVANALRGARHVSQETRERVMTKARELGYEPNSMLSSYLQIVRSKKPGSLGNIALLNPLYGGGERRSFDTMPQNYRSFLIAMDKRAVELGYSFDPIDSLGQSTAVLNRMLQARGVVGVIINPLPKGMSHLSLNWSKFAAVATSYTLVRPSLHRVAHHHAHGMALALRMCRRKGFRRVGFALSSESDHRSNGFWLAAYLHHQFRLPLKHRVNPLFLPQVTPESIQKWIRKERMEAAIFHNHWTIPDIPEIYNGKTGDVPTIVLDRDPDDFSSGIDQQFSIWGAKAIDQLSLQLLHNEKGIPANPTVTMIPPKWKDGRSLA